MLNYGALLNIPLLKRLGMIDKNKNGAVTVLQPRDFPIEIALPDTDPVLLQWSELVIMLNEGGLPTAYNDLPDT